MGRLRVALLGATGRMGRIVQDLIVNDPTARDAFVLVCSSSGPQDPSFQEIKSQKPHVLIDFSAPASSLAAAKVCAAVKIPMIVCTTGFTKDEMGKLNLALKKTPWILAPNTSLGICALGQALKAAFKVLPNTYDVSVVEIHHSEKKDAPSGTATHLERIIAVASGRENIPVLSIRGGTEPGEHKIVILGAAERLEFTHRAGNRSLFAHGALRLAQSLVKLKAKGRAYSVEEVLML